VKQKRFNVEQIVAVLNPAEAGVPLAELIWRVGISRDNYRMVGHSELIAKSFHEKAGHSQGGFVFTALSRNS